MRRGGRDRRMEALIAYEVEGLVWATGGMCCSGASTVAAAVAVA